MTLAEDAERLLYRPGAPRPTWTDYGHPELEGSPLLATVNGYYRVPALPPPPGRRDADGSAHP